MHMASKSLSSIPRAFLEQRYCACMTQLPFLLHRFDLHYRRLETLVLRAWYITCWRQQVSTITFLLATCPDQQHQLTVRLGSDVDRESSVLRSADE